MPREGQIISWELMLVIGLFGVNYGFMLNYLRNVIYVSGLIDNPIDLLIFLYFTVVIYGIVTLAFAIYYMYSVTKKRKRSGYDLAESKFDRISVRSVMFMILMIGRILSVSWAPVGWASLTVGILQILIPNEVVVNPNRVLAVTIESIIFFVLWLAVYGVVFAIERYVSRRGERN